MVFKCGGTLSEISLWLPEGSDGALPVTFTGVKCDGDSGKAVDVEAPLGGVDPPEASYSTAPTTAPDKRTAPLTNAILIPRDDLVGRGEFRMAALKLGKCVEGMLRPVKAWSLKARRSENWSYWSFLDATRTSNCR